MICLPEIKRSLEAQDARSAHFESLNPKFWFFRVWCEDLANTVLACGSFWLTTKRRSTRRVWVFLTIHPLFFVLKLFFFVIFVSSVVNTSPQEIKHRSPPSLNAFA